MGELETIISKRASREGHDLPDRIKNAPEIHPWLMVYMNAFFALDTQRSHANGVTRIPWLDVRQYALIHNFDKRQTEDLHYYIQLMDITICKRIAASMEKKLKGGNDGGKPA